MERREIVLQITTNQIVMGLYAMGLLNVKPTSDRLGVILALDPVGRIVVSALEYAATRKVEDRPSPRSLFEDLFHD
jgi:hypothetical protein